MTTKQTSIISDPASEPTVLNQPTSEGGKLRTISGTVELATTDIDAADTIELCDLPTNASVKRILLYNDDLDAATGITADVGLYTTALVVKDIDAYASVITTLQAANTLGVDVAFEARDIANINKRVWEDAGDSEDPGGLFRLVVTINVVAGTAQAGTLSFLVVYAVAA